MKEIVENSKSPSAIKSIVHAKIQSIIDECLEREKIDLPSIVEKLEKIHVKPSKNPDKQEIFWDSGEGKYYNKSTDMYLTTKDLKVFGLMEDYMADQSVDLVEAVIEEDESKIEECVSQMFLAALGKMSTETFSSLDENSDEPLVTEAKMIKKVNAKGEVKRRLSCGPGRELKDGVCVITSGSKKIERKKSHLKSVRTKKAQGAGYALKVAKKTKLAKMKRKSMGIHEGVTTRDAIGDVLGMMSFGGVKVPMADYSPDYESWDLDVTLTPSEMKALGTKLEAKYRDRFQGVKVSRTGKQTRVSVKL